MRGCADRNHHNLRAKSLGTSRESPHVPGTGHAVFLDVNQFDGKAPVELYEHRKEVFIAAYDWYLLMNQEDPSRQRLLWYRLDERLGYVFRNFSAISHLWQGRLVNEQLPLVVVPEAHWSGPTSILPRAGDELILLSEEVDEMFEQAQRSMRRIGLSLEIVRPISLKTSGRELRFLMVRVGGDALKSEH